MMTTTIHPVQHCSPMIGVAYYRPPSPPLSEWEADFMRMKEMGFDVVKMWMYWGWHERQPGKFDWSESDFFFDLADRHGLQLAPNIILELPPSWLPLTHRLESPRGFVERAHFPGIYIPCFDDPAVRAAAEPFVEELARRYAHRNIAHWDVWNEPRSKYACICEASRQRYAEWLARKYGTIENYNRFFGKCFHDWTAAAYYLKGGACYAEEFNWRLWAAEQLADQVHWVARLVKRMDYVHPVMCHVGISSPLQSVRYDTCVDALTMDGLDFYGSSFDAAWESQAYVTDIEHVRPLYQQANLTRAKIQVDWLRSLSSRNWICELYANLYNAWETRKPDMLLWQFWQVLSRGLAGVMIWEFKTERIGVESLGYGLIGLDGRPNDRSAALAAAICLVKTDLAEFFRDYTLVESTLGILYDERSHLLSEFEGFYNPKFGGIYQQSLLGLYELLRRRNIPVRLVPHQHLETVLPTLSTMFLPGHSYMDDGLADTLKRFVENGGHLIGQAGTGFRQANTWVSTVIPSYGLDALFGAQERTRVFTEETIPITDAEGGVIENVAGFKINLECLNGKVIGRFPDGETAIVQNKAGKGLTHYLGAFLGVRQPHAGQGLARLGISAPDSTLTQLADLGFDAIPWKKRSNTGRCIDAYFIFNEKAEAAEFAPTAHFTRRTVLSGTCPDNAGKIRLGANSSMLLW